MGEDLKKVYLADDGKFFLTKEEAVRHELNMLHVILIDDDIEILEIFTNLLHKAGYTNFKTFSDPMSATAYLSQNKVDHVFTDYHMPLKGMSGMTIKEKCNELRIPCTTISADNQNAELSKIDLVSNIIPILRTISE